MVNLCAKLLPLFYTDCFKTYQMLLSCYVNVHVFLSLNNSQIFLHFSKRVFVCPFLLKICTDCFETLRVLMPFSEGRNSL